MAAQSAKQKKVMERVMHEYKHGELATSTGKKVKGRRQAVAIGLREAGASKYETPKENRRSLERTKRRERRGETARQIDEGKSPRTRRKARARDETRATLYRRAQRKGVKGRSSMSKSQLKRALHK